MPATITRFPAEQSMALPPLWEKQLKHFPEIILFHIFNILLLANKISDKYYTLSWLDSGTSKSKQPHDLYNLWYWHIGFFFTAIGLALAEKVHSIHVQPERGEYKI